MAGNWQLISSSQERKAAEQILNNCKQLPDNEGVVIGSGGSSGHRRWCLQPWRNLEAAAISSGAWLESIGIELEQVVVVNPLPKNHMGGLMPQVRATLWKVPVIDIPTEQLKTPSALLGLFNDQKGFKTRNLVLSMVPTQLIRLMADPAGCSWLKQFRLIWVGGAGLNDRAANHARSLKLQLAPCYGATETAGMVSALTPKDFLSGINNCGRALSDVKLKINPSSKAIEVRSKRLSSGWINGAKLEQFTNSNGWWCSGDAGQIDSGGLQIIGRLDWAINSGGATVFPEQVEGALCHCKGVASLLLVGLPDPEWGEQLVALVRIKPEANQQLVIKELCITASKLPPAERPKKWILCPQLNTNPTGKWDRKHWLEWANKQDLRKC
jgi:O-succinylbenzoic acid--CoA ligase